MRNFKASFTGARSNRTVTGITKKYKGVAPRMVALRAELKLLRDEWRQKVAAKAAAAS